MRKLALSIIACLMVLSIVVVYSQEADKPADDMATKIDKLVEKLKSEDFNERKSAQDELVKIGKPALERLEAILAKTTDVDLKFRLGAIIEGIKKGKTDDEAAPRPRPLPRTSSMTMSIKPDGSIVMVVKDDEGAYTLEQDKQGKVKVTAQPNEGEKETREFANRETFEKEWPEIAQKFGSMRLRVKPMPNLGDKELEDLEKRMKKLNEEFDKRMKELEKNFEKFGDPQDPKAKPFEQKDGVITLMTIDKDGTQYIVNLDRQGKITAIILKKEGEKTEKKFDSIDKLEKEWPEFYEKFPKLKETLEMARKRQSRPFPEAPQTPEAEELLKQLLKKLEEEFGKDNPMGPSEDMKKLLEELMKRSLPKTDPASPEDDSHKTKPAGSVLDATFGDVSEVVRNQLDIPAGQGIQVNALNGETGFFRDAGVQQHDIILALNDMPLADAKTLDELLKSLAPGTEVKLKIIRKGKTVVLTTKVPEKKD